MKRDLAYWLEGNAYLHNVRGKMERLDATKVKHLKIECKKCGKDGGAVIVFDLSLKAALAVLTCQHCGEKAMKVRR